MRAKFEDILIYFNPKLPIHPWPASCEVGGHVMEYIYGSYYHHHRPEFLTNVKEDQAFKHYSYFSLCVFDKKIFFNNNSQVRCSPHPLKVGALLQYLILL
jgi:hypothetical protein